MANSKSNTSFVTQEELKMLVQDLEATRQELKENKKAIKVLHKEVSFLKNPPMTFVCATHFGNQPSLGEPSQTGKTIPFTNIPYSSTNVESVFDMDTGVF